MKNVLFFALGLVASLSLCSCGDDKEDEDLREALEGSYVYVASGDVVITIAGESESINIKELMDYDGITLEKSSNGNDVMYMNYTCNDVVHPLDEPVRAIVSDGRIMFESETQTETMDEITLQCTFNHGAAKVSGNVITWTTTITGTVIYGSYTGLLSGSYTNKAIKE